MRRATSSGAFPPLPHPEPKEENGFMFEKFDWMLARYQELSEAVSQPEIIADQARWQRLLKEHAALEPAVEAYRAYQKTLSDLAEAARC